MSYLTFEDYLKLGGKCTQDAFLDLQIYVESSMDYITFGRLSKMIGTLSEVPQKVKALETKLINIANNSNMERDSSITSYSNGIESYGYGNSYSAEGNIDNDLVKRMQGLMMQYLYSDYPQLFYRGRGRCMIY